MKWETATPDPMPHSACSSHHDNILMAEPRASEMLGTVDNGTSEGPVF